MTSNLDEPLEVRDPRTYNDGALGIFTMVALILLTWGFCWMKSYSSFRIPQRINVVFTEVAGLSKFAGVYLDGVRVGVVDQLEWQGQQRVLVQLRINAPKVEIPVGSKFLILTNGIVGAKFVEIHMPTPKEGEQSPPPITDSAIVLGDDPVRPEIAINKVAIGLSDVDLGQLNKNLVEDQTRLMRTMDDLSVLSRKVGPVLDRALPLENEFIALSHDTRKVSARLNQFLRNPELPEDLRRTVEEAKETADAVEGAMHEMCLTLKDKEMRGDLLHSIDTLNKATSNIQNSVEVVQQLAGDQQLRSDVKQILGQTSDSLNKVEQVLNKPSFGSDIRATVRDTRDAINDVDVVARRLNSMLGKRFPLMRMMFGKPGQLDEDGKKKRKDSKDDAKDDSKDSSGLPPFGQAGGDKSE